MFQTRVKKKIKAHSYVQLYFFFPKIMRLLDNVKKCGTARQATDYNTIWLRNFSCRI